MSVDACDVLTWFGLGEEAFQPAPAAPNRSHGYREIPPPTALRDVVACLWMRVAGIAGEVRIMPDGCTDVVWQQGAGVTIAGPDTTAKLVGRAQNDLLVGMRFLPGAGGGALGVPLDALRDLHVDVAEVDRGLDLDGDLAPSEVLARFVSAAASTKADLLVVEAARRIDRSGVRAVARDLWVSERQLLRRFHAGSATAQRPSRGSCASDGSWVRSTAGAQTSRRWRSKQAMPTRRT